jgi:hypothetical protein
MHFNECPKCNVPQISKNHQKSLISNNTLMYTASIDQKYDKYDKPFKPPNHYKPP